MSGLGMIWAQDVTGVLGADGGMLWRVPADFAHFKATTMGCGLVMGRTTWESLGGPLPGRRNVVLTRDRSWRAEGAVSRRGKIAACLGMAVGYGLFWLTVRPGLWLGLAVALVMAACALFVVSRPSPGGRDGV